MGLPFKEKVLYHQIHPLKLATDILASCVSLYFFWQHRLAVALVVHFLPPVVASIVLIRYARLDAYAGATLGRYIKRFMTRPVEALRLCGDVVMILGAWYHRPLV